MSKRIGELLVQKGLLTPEELEVGLSAQLVYGGHLGTCLIEQGLVSEADLGRVLADSYGVGYAGADVLDAVPDPLIECFPLKIAEKYSMVPFRMENGTLHLAMINPRQGEALTAASCSTGFKTQGWVAPEIRIYQALERYYRIPRRLRFVALCRELDRSTPSDRLPKAESSEPAPVRIDHWPPPEQKPVYDLGARSDESDTAEHRDLQDLGAEFGYGQSWQDFVETDNGPRAAVERAPAPPEAVTPRSQAEPASVPISPDEPLQIDVPKLDPPAAAGSGLPAPIPVASLVTLEAMGSRLVGAASLENVASGFLDWAVAGTPRCLLWRVDGLTAMLWDWRGFAIDAETQKRLTMTVTEEPILRLVAGSTCYRGPIPEDVAYRSFLERLGASPAAEIELVPLHMDDRLVALFYGDCGKGPTIKIPSSDYRRALLKLGYALWMLRLKQKVLNA